MDLKQPADSSAPRPARVGAAMPTSGRVDPSILGSLFAPGTGGHYDSIVDRVLEGRDRAWKEALLAEIQPPRRVLDLACGTGILTWMLRDRFPDCEIVGVDFTGEYLDVARRRAVERGDSRVRFIHSAAEDAPLEGLFDCIMTCYLPKYADLGQLVPKLVEHLEPGGLMIMQDFVWPRDRLTAQFLDRRFDRLIEWAQASLPEAVGMFADLRPILQQTRWVEELAGMMDHCGLVDVRRRYFDPEEAAMVWGRLPRAGSSGAGENQNGG